MDKLEIDPAAVIALADSFERNAPLLEELGARLVRAAAPIKTGDADLDAETRAAVGKMRDALAACASAFEAVADQLDWTVEKYVTTNDQAAADQSELLERLRALQGGQSGQSGQGAVS